MTTLDATAQVHISGLLSRVDLNGKLGKVIGPLIRGRYPVNIDGECVLVKPENLVARESDKYFASPDELGLILRCLLGDWSEKPTIAALKCVRRSGLGAVHHGTLPKRLGNSVSNLTVLLFNGTGVQPRPAV